MSSADEQRRASAATSAGTAPPIPPHVLMIIRFAYFAGAFLFGAVTWLRYRSLNVAPEAAADFGVLARLVPFVQVLLLAGAIGVRTLLARRAARHDALPGEDSGLRLGAWALGESAALVGGVHYFLVGQPHYWIIGMVVLLATFLIVPLRQGDAR